MNKKSRLTLPDMKDKKHTKQEILAEGKRYWDNAAAILKKSTMVEGIYTDKKYVKTAGHTTYAGILTVLNMSGIMPWKRGRKSVDDYIYVLSGENKKIQVTFNYLYERLNLSVGYDGSLSKDEFLQLRAKANDIIEWAAGKAQS